MPMTEYHEQFTKIGGIIFFIIGIILLLVAIRLWVINDTNLLFTTVVLIVALELLMVGSMWLLIYFFRIRKKAPNSG